jgi:hypothetical protein
MSRLISMCTLVITAAACGSDGPLIYSDPPAGGALRLVKNPKATPKAMKLDLIVGSAALTGYSVGFNLPLDAKKVTLGTFTPGTALAPGTAPVAASATIPAAGPLAGTLVTGQSQKATGAGAVASDTVLAPNTVLYTIELDVVEPLVEGVVFDGTAKTFVLPSGGLRNKMGMTIVDPSQVKIGKLELSP